ncbi:YfjI family protein [Geopseudomonas aromaticivorans]
MESFKNNDIINGDASYSYIDLNWLDEFPIFKEAVQGIAERSQAPIELIVSVLLSVISLACQYLIDVKRPWGSTGPTSLIVFTIALSGERKSTVERIATDALRAFRERREKLDAQKTKEWSVLLELWSKQKKKIQKEIIEKDPVSPDYKQLEKNLLAHANSVPMRPFVFKMIQQDVTQAALTEALEEYCPSEALLTSEGDIALRGVIGQVGIMNALWDASGVEVGRASTGSYSLKDARFSIGIGVQPLVFQDYLERKGEAGKASGFFARALFFYPKSTQGNRFIGAKTSLNLDRYTKRMELLLEENFRKFDARDSEKQVVEFSAEAGEELVRIHNRIEKELQAGGIYERARDHASKLTENISRVAALLHFFETGLSKISTSELASAEKIVTGCSVVYKRLFSFSPQAVIDADLLLSWLQERSQSPLFRRTRKNEILQRGPSGLRRAARLNRAIDYLVENGVAKIVKCGRVSEIELVLN